MVSTAAGPGYDLELKLAEMKINGFVVLPQVVPKAQIAAMHEAFLPLLDAVVARDPGLDADDARRRIASQMPTSLKVQRADVVLENSSTKAALAAQVASLVSKLREIA